MAFDPAHDSAEQLKEQVLSLTKGAGVRYAIDPVGGSTAAAVVSCLGLRGRLILYGTLSGEPVVFNPRELLTVGGSVEGFWLGHWMERQGLFGKLKLVRTLSRLLLDGTLHSEVSATYPLENVAAAVRHAEQLARGGKILLKIGEP